MIKSKTKVKNQALLISLDLLFGAYQSKDTAEEIIEAIKASKIFSRSIEML